MDLGKYQNSIDNLNNINLYRYENIFKVYQDENTYYFYNILKNINFPNDLDINLYYTRYINFDLPLKIISYNIYGTTELWWLILVVNHILNPFIKGIKTVKIIKKEYLNDILNNIKEQLQ